MTRFRLKDDDGEIYYYGQMPDADINGNEEVAFAPLNWGMADAGCTIMEWYDKAKKMWKIM